MRLIEIQIYRDVEIEGDMYNCTSTQRYGEWDRCIHKDMWWMREIYAYRDIENWESYVTLWKEAKIYT